MKYYRVMYGNDSSRGLYHFRTKGSKNGQRLYQNADGTYTELGKERRRIGNAESGGSFRSQKKALQKELKERNRLSKVQARYDAEQQKTNTKVQQRILKTKNRKETDRIIKPRGEFTRKALATLQKTVLDVVSQSLKQASKTKVSQALSHKSKSTVAEILKKNQDITIDDIQVLKQYWTMVGIKQGRITPQTNQQGKGKGKK